MSVNCWIFSSSCVWYSPADLCSSSSGTTPGMESVKVKRSKHLTLRQSLTRVDHTPYNHTMNTFPVTYFHMWTGNLFCFLYLKPKTFQTIFFPLHIAEFQSKYYNAYSGTFAGYCLLFISKCLSYNFYFYFCLNLFQQFIVTTHDIDSEHAMIYIKKYGK